jgi:hypothetical protein
MRNEYFFLFFVDVLLESLYKRLRKHEIETRKLVNLTLVVRCSSHVR